MCCSVDRFLRTVLCEGARSDCFLPLARSTSLLAIAAQDGRGRQHGIQYEVLGGGENRDIEACIFSERSIGCFPIWILTGYTLMVKHAGKITRRAEDGFRDGSTCADRN